ncbi:hypothetical protein KFK09_022031 [Dendrobium nobile]|uniref:DUF4283 domain-containing protein n=1 Tax=Dendrobium nobile TaxID=94219 RepID=A0A8T3AHU9_DENNO|nr:hypothetical protein KFK09_022031 [Dendrobium nobile]
MASSSSYCADFPPLPGVARALPPCPSILGGLNFLSNLTKKDPIAGEFSVSFVPPSKKIPFSADDLALGVPDWGSCLVGYSIGPRPTYMSLLNVAKKAWNPKGSLELLSLNDGFFLFKFASPEDYQLAWTGGPWFFFGRPFILQQWTPKFKPTRDEFTSIPLWIKIVDLPLAVWNPTGISKIASYVGHPLVVDALTARKTRLTFARVCVMVSSASSLPDEIPISMDGDDVSLKVIYDWKPSHCSGCGSIVHPSTLCHINPQPKPPMTNPRGRSTSRKHSSRPPNHRPPLPSTLPPPPTSTIPVLPPPSSVHEPGGGSLPPPTLVHVQSPTSGLLPPPQLSTVLLKPPPIQNNDPIPNLNSPTEDVSAYSEEASSSDNLPSNPQSQMASSPKSTSSTFDPASSSGVVIPKNPQIVSPNRFQILEPKEPPDEVQTSSAIIPPKTKTMPQNPQKPNGKSAKKTRTSSSKSK